MLTTTPTTTPTATTHDELPIDDWGGDTFPRPGMRERERERARATTHDELPGDDWGGDTSPGRE